MIIKKISAATLFLFMIIAGQCQSPAVLSAERVRKDLLEANEGGIPSKEEVANATVTVFNLRDHQIAHLAYKTGGAEAFMKQSFLLVYKVQMGDLERVQLEPSNYDFSLVDSATQTFLSDNRFCIGGQCTNYIEILTFKNGQFEVISEYSGFDYSMHVFDLFAYDSPEEGADYLGDTIVYQVSVSEFIFNEVELLSYKLKTETQVLEGWDDIEELITKDDLQEQNILLH